MSAAESYERLCRAIYGKPLAFQDAVSSRWRAWLWGFDHLEGLFR